MTKTPFTTTATSWCFSAGTGLLSFDPQEYLSFLSEGGLGTYWLIAGEGRRLPFSYANTYVHTCHRLQLQVTMTDANLTKSEEAWKVEYYKPNSTKLSLTPSMNPKP
jgi:hypothetical protein